MKKYFFLLAAFGFFLITSCSDDDDNGAENGTIIANWELTAVTPQIPGWDPSACPENPDITFTENGSAMWTLYDSENDCAEFSSSGTWEKNSDNTYTISIPNFGTFDGTVKFSGANKFTFTTSFQSIPVVLTFEK
ncbi:lipocalin family protein [Salinimicrobium oceani]|uniref:Lipocalin-like domain-containing protein n=1 Tax=Salinimicrobium oceani TaxID=2722702 RepID=A0ABX1CTR3_9FLAO|nr:lipocalin family protein [Salinimicrobium oceani]NJW51681.1 hypothetical protein [Salinimicrobium oceani]